MVGSINEWDGALVLCPTELEAEVAWWSSLQSQLQFLFTIVARPQGELDAVEQGGR